MPEFEIWTDEDKKARDELRSWFMTYPVDQDDIDMNEVIAHAPLKKLVEAVTNHDHQMKMMIAARDARIAELENLLSKSQKGFKIECLNIPPHD